MSAATQKGREKGRRIGNEKLIIATCDTLTGTLSSSGHSGTGLDTVTTLNPTAGVAGNPSFPRRVHLPYE